MAKKIIVGITGASGVIYGIHLLEVLRQLKVETHLIMSPAAKVTIAAETNYSIPSVEKLATKVYKFSDISATISSGSFPVDGMVVVPCSMHTLGALATGVADSLLTRAGEVTMKEKRPLIVVPRETPLTLIHIENMARLARAGAVVLPAMPAFYTKPKSLDDVVYHIVGKILDILRIENTIVKRWKGMPSGT